MAKIVLHVLLLVVLLLNAIFAYRPGDGCCVIWRHHGTCCMNEMKQCCEGLEPDRGRGGRGGRRDRWGRRRRPWDRDRPSVWKSELPAGDPGEAMANVDQMGAFASEGQTNPSSSSIIGLQGQDDQSYVNNGAQQSIVF